MHLLGPVPGDGIVGSDLVVFDALLLGALGEHQHFVDLVDVERSYFRVCESALA